VPKCEVICCSYYDDKPFHMMGNTSDGISVIEWHRKCFNSTTQRHFYVIVKRLSLADLDFHVAVTTAWCKTPELVLEYKKEVPQVDAAAPGQGRGTPKMSDEKHTAAIESYEAGLIRHELDFPSSKTSGCQVVGSNGPTARRAPRAPRTAMSCPSGRISVRR